MASPERADALYAIQTAQMALVRLRAACQDAGNKLQRARLNEALDELSQATRGFVRLSDRLSDVYLNATREADRQRDDEREAKWDTHEP